ncbi:protein MODIFIER OF SNC1 1 [Cocos nucifera]|uniref:Protein MODIFIER OF SNC1 1 n=1 Tax=Cocos nucifera TaxID=13894 RepID=A0A8K0HS66_COCNU|nr:protein MODIFIER OF SNC1 1 [Cocos nucifera]
MVYRWASTRKSGMTVLGKVPKPINLPSQRLENNGLDPNVEIVPKGTLTWGSRPSSAAPNAWSSSTLLSPKTDGSTGSPSHMNGRPSSGGSGTRPSTAGSDRSHEAAPNAWGPNSRPSSASGLLAPNQTSIVATRPRSAETRPGSSQLSRFAENSAESTVAWGSTRIAERLGPPSSKTNGFTLSSGDFPTLGSEKNSESHSQRGPNSQSRPTSASGTDAAPKERLESPLSGDARVAECSEQRSMNTQKADNYLHVGGGAPPNMNWQMEPQYPSLNMTPHQFDSWRGPPLHSPDGIWYRGGGLGGPCRPTGPPGGFPADHFGYYPQFPPSSDAVPRQGAGQGGYHPNNGETYRPHVPPNSFVVASHAVLPARPGVYQAPVPYDGYHGMPQAGFCSYSEREVPFLGVASRPGVYNQHPHQNSNLNPGQFHIRPGGHDPPMAMETDRAHGTHQGTHQGQYKVLLKQHDGLEDNKLQEMGQPVACNPPHFDKGSKRGRSAQEASRCTNSRKDEQAVLGRSKPDCEGFSKPSSDLEGHSSEPVSMDSQKNSDKATDGILMRPETAVSVAHDRQGHPVTKKNATLIEKIEGLNNKARSADGHSEVTPFAFREEKTKLRAATRKADHSPKTICSNVITMENAPSSGMVIPSPGELNSSTLSNDVKLSSDWKTVPGPSESQVIAVGKSDSSELGEVGHSHNYGRDNAMRARVDYHAKSRSNSQVDDVWTKESPGRDSSVLITVTNGENGPRGGVPDGHSFQEATAKESLHSIHSASASYTPSLDSLDYQAQEIATQRAKQLQKEEEERTKEQKAKALAKLEELNRRSSAQSSKQKLNDSIPTSIDMQHKEDSGVDTVLKTDATNNEVPDVMLAENSDVLIQANDTNPKTLHAPAELPSDITSHTSNNVTQDPAIYHDPSLALRQETNNTVVASQTMGSQIHDTSISKHKHLGYRRRQTISTEKNASENPIASGNMESPKNLAEMAVDASISDSLHHTEDPSVQHKKKNTKNSRNKNKLDEASMSSTTPSLAHTEEGIEKGPIDCQKTHPPASAVETVSVPTQNSSEISGTQGSRDVMVTSSKQEWSKATEQARARSSNQWKPQPSRRSARNQQGIKPGDKFHGGEAVFWAPVKQQNKNEQQPEEISQSSMTDASSQSLEKKEHDIHNGMKTKRAEMERYVPKPVAKEMSHQANSQQPSFLKQGASSDKSGRPEFDSRSLDGGRPDGLAVGKTEFLADTKNGEENKPNRRGKTHASWRQRNSAESASAFQSSGEGSGSSGAKVVQNPSDSQLEKQFKSDDWDSNNDNAVPTEPIASLAGVKDEGITSRQKRQQFKVHRVAGNNRASAGNKDLETGIDDKGDIRTPAPNLNEPDLRNASKTDMRSHWKPKSHANSHKQGNRSNGGQRVAFHSGRSDKEFASKGFESNPLQEDADALIQKNGVGESHQEAKGCIKVTADPSKQQTHIPNKDVPINAELGPENVKAQHEHQVVASPRRHGQHNGRFIRGQEAAYRGRDSGQDAGRQNFHRHGDRRKNNSHYEYQPIGPFDKPSDSSQWNSHVGEESREISRAPGLRFRERDHNHSRHGGQFFRRSSGAAVHVGEPYNDGD